jgi:hypothetical protein
MSLGIEPLILSIQTGPVLRLGCVHPWSQSEGFNNGSNRGRCCNSSKVQKNFHNTLDWHLNASRAHNYHVTKRNIMVINMCVVFRILTEYMLVI